jgi:Zn-dependent protease with chaperone function
MLALSYWMNSRHHAALVQRATPVTARTLPPLDALVRQTAARLGVSKVRAYVAPAASLNAYTFGLDDPKVIVLYSGLLRALDADELRFIVGHELGHIRLGHTWLNSLLGGLAGIPSPFGAAIILYFAFRGWNRSCEFSADRAGLLACGRLETAISALVKVATQGLAKNRSAREPVPELRREDDLGSLLVELSSTHPLISRRIDELKRYAASEEYRRHRERL